MIKLISVKCPECGAALQFEEGRQTAFCSYCGTKILLHNENEYIYRNIDEAEIKQAENDRLYIMKELESEEKQEKHYRTLTFIWLFITIALFAIGLYFIKTDTTEVGSIGSDVGAVGAIMVFLGISVGLFGLMAFFIVHIDEQEKKNKKKRSHNRYRPGYLKLPDQAANYKNLHFTAVRDSLKASGFSNIEMINLGDLRLGILTKNGSVDSVMIDGESISIDGESISSDEWYRQEAKIIISYHGFPDI